MKIFLLLIAFFVWSGVFFIPDNFFVEFHDNVETKKDIINGILTTITFLSGFILLILPMKVSDFNQAYATKLRLHNCLIKRNGFLTVLFVLILVTIVMLLFSFNVTNVLFTKILLATLILILFSIIRLFFIIKEYVEYPDDSIGSSSN